MIEGNQQYTTHLGTLFIRISGRWYYQNISKEYWVEEIGVPATLKICQASVQILKPDLLTEFIASRLMGKVIEVSANSLQPWTRKTFT